MAPGAIPFRVRAASLLHPFTGTKPGDDAPSEKPSRSRRASTEPYVNEKPLAGENGDDGGLSTSVVAGGDTKHGVGSAVAHDRTAHGIVRSVPGQFRYQSVGVVYSWRILAYFIIDWGYVR